MIKSNLSIVTFVVCTFAVLSEDTGKILAALKERELSCQVLEEPIKQNNINERDQSLLTYYNDNLSRMSWKLMIVLSLSSVHGFDGQTQSNDVEWIHSNGITDVPELQPPFFGLFLTVYTVVVVGNLGLIILTELDPRLQKPMCFSSVTWLLLI